MVFVQEAEAPECLFQLCINAELAQIFILDHIDHVDDGLKLKAAVGPKMDDRLLGGGGGIGQMIGQFGFADFVRTPVNTA